MNDHIAGFTAIHTQTPFAINTFLFVFFAVGAIFLSRLLWRSRFHAILLCTLNSIFLSFILPSFYEFFVLFSLLLSIYFFGTVHNIFKSFLGIFQFLCVIGLWITIFFMKDPLLLPTVNIFSYFPVQILGISYIVFRGISYLMESRFVEKNNFFDFISYILFFPTLISGPIERYTHFTKKQNRLNHSDFRWENSLDRILNGFIKKFVIADNLMAFGIFSLSHDPSISSPLLLWVGALSMLFLIYLDFSGYCDIMIGISEIMGFRINENFNRPFISHNIQEFWTRWHISLGSIIQDYVFTPINKVIMLNFPRKVQFIFIMLSYFFALILVALWHGTTLGFFVFGTLQGAVLVLFQLKKKYIKTPLTPFRVNSFGFKFMNYLPKVLTYSFVSISLIWWHDSIPHALKTFKLLLGF